nr:8906_t:CDS:2 [Entrophospora candida]
MASQPIFINAVIYISIFIFLGYLAYDLQVEIRELNVITQEIKVESRDSLVPPALTFCITKDVAYSFNITVQGVTTSNDYYLKSYDPSSPELAYSGLNVARCWIMKSPSNTAVIQENPTNQNVEDMVFTYTRTFDTPGPQVKTPVLINVFDPLEIDSLFRYNRFLKLDPDINRAIHFSRTQNVDINKKVTNDVKYNIIDEFQEIQPSTASSTNKITIRAVRDVKPFNLNGLFRNTITLISSLFTAYVLLAGKGRYAPWGVVHHIFRYFPVEHIEPKDTVTNIEDKVFNTEDKAFGSEKKLNDIEGKLNIIETKLGLYLSRFDGEKRKLFFC